MLGLRSTSVLSVSHYLITDYSSQMHEDQGCKRVSEWAEMNRWRLGAKRKWRDGTDGQIDYDKEN